MKICLLSRFFDLRNAGIGRYSMELREALSNLGHEIMTVSQDGGLPIGEGPKKYLAYTAFEILFKIPKDCDVYHACSPMEAFHAPGPLTIFVHDLIPLLKIGTNYTAGAFTKFRRWFAANYFKLACTAATEKADIIMVQSEETKNQLCRTFAVHPKKVRVVRHGINPSLKPGDGRSGEFTVGTLSYLDPRKRIDLLIEAFLEADVEGKLLIGGNGVDRRRLKALTGGDPRIKFLGFLREDKLSDFYNSLDVFVFPSEVEGYGLPIVEAMACKVPVVTLQDSRIPSDVKGRTIVVRDLAEWLRSPRYSGIDLDENHKFARLHDWRRSAEEHLKAFEEAMA